MNTSPVCLMSRVLWKPQAASWWMEGEVLSHWCLQTVHGRFGFTSVTGAHGANVTDVQLLTSAARESIFAESRERWMYFQVCLCCSIVRLINSTEISTKKKNDRMSVLLQSKKPIHQSHTSARSQGKHSQGRVTSYHMHGVSQNQT